MELHKRNKLEWIIQVMQFVNLTNKQLIEIKSYSKEKINQNTQYIIQNYNTKEISLSMYFLHNGIIIGKLNRLQTIPEYTDSLYYYAIAAGSIPSMYHIPDTFEESSYEDSKNTYEDYLEEISEDFVEKFNNNVEKIFELEAQLD